MNLEDLKNKKVAVLGLSVEGLSTAKFLMRNQINFTVLDKKEFSQMDEFDQKFLESSKIETKLGVSYLRDLKTFQIIFRSPGFPLWHPKLLESQKEGTVITSQTKLFFDLCPCPVIGVTGTKGKGTTASLLYEMLKESGKDVFLAGNIGVPPLDFLETLKVTSTVVLELSSFQLEDLKKSPSVAVVLMSTQDHLASQAGDSPNYHWSVDEYLQAKMNIVRFQKASDSALINYDFVSSRDFSLESKARIFYFSLKEEFEDGAFLLGDDLVVRLSRKTERIACRSEVFLRGEHNLQNILAASLAALISGAKLEAIQKVIKIFKGLEHRLEFVSEVKGVKYYDDSFSTTPETAIAAIKSFSEPLIVILGGSEKGSDYTELGRTIIEAENIKAVILIGLTALKIKESLRQGLIGLDPLRGSNPFGDKVLKIVEGLSSMEEVVERAFKLGRSGDVVLLSPACASFDMFKNYKDRGNQFKGEVGRL